VSAEGNRDRAVELGLMRAMAAEPGTVPTGECVDAETLAAWVDGGLDASTRSRVETHAAGCARCQGLVAMIVQSEPEPEAQAPGWNRVLLRWLVPLTAVAAATLVWMVTPRPLSEPVAEPQATAARAEPPPAAFVEPPATLAEPRTTVAAPGASAPAPPGGAQASATAPPPAKDSREQPAPAEEAARGRPADRSNVDTAVRQAPAVAAPRVDLAAKREAESALEKATTAQEAQVEGRRAEAGGAVRPATAPAAPAPAANALEMGVARRVAARAPRAITSAIPEVQWRFAEAGVVERSLDGGRTWSRLATGVTAEFTAGSAPTATVCWLVGRAGIVVLTADAATWARVTSPTSADLVSVEAIDARTAMVRAADGRAFRTSDAGASWTPVP
jgi:hypothetical protein